MNDSRSTTLAGSAASRAVDRRAPQAVAIWLLVCCALVFAIVVVGGVTRLTHSGLSITEWQPVTGTIPPLSEAAWQAEFDKYKTIPQYQQMNRGMSLGEFKTIFWWEWTHRLLGRVIGAAFLLPFLWFLWRGWVEPGLRSRLWAIFGLGALQGAVDRGENTVNRMELHRAAGFRAIAADPKLGPQLDELCRQIRAKLRFE